MRKEPPLRRNEHRPPEAQYEKFDFNPSWMRDVKANPLPALLRHEKPSVTLSVLRNLYDLDFQDERYKVVEQDVFGQHSWRIVFKPQRQPGVSFPSDDEEKSTAFAFLDQLYRVHRIMVLGGSTYLPPVKSEIVKLMKYQNEDGRFPLLYHHHAHACWLLLKLGMEGNRLLDKAIFWILERQREDGGWLHRTMTPKGKKYEEVDSCIWTSAEVLQLISSRKSFQKSKQAKLACEFILDRLLKMNTTNLFPPVEAWDHLAIGSSGESIFAGGSLKVMEAVTRCGYTREDARLNKLYKWLISIQMENGYFPRIAGKLPVADGMVTVRSLSVIRQLSKNRGKV